MNSVWRIALYIRLSRDDGNDESMSISNQRKILMEYVGQFFKEDGKLIDVYADDGQTGTDFERPEFQRMLRDIEAGKVNCIICKNLSRAFRNYSDQGYFLEKIFPKFHIRFITLGDPKIDTFINPEAVSGMEVPINGLMNDRFAYKTSSDIRRTFDTKRRKGEFIGAFAPYGYKKNPDNKNHLIIDEEAAAVVRDIFKWYVYGDERAKPAKHPEGGMSKEGIARKLNDMGILNPAAYKRSKGLKYCSPQSGKNDGLWQSTGVRRILSNEMYIGTMVQGKQRVISYKVHDRVAVPKAEWYRRAHTHEPIIDERLFALAREIQDKDLRRAPGKREYYMLSGLVKCADCRRAMTRRRAKQFVYLNCSTYKRKSKTKCSIHSMRLDVLEKAVLTAIQYQIALVGNPDEIIRQIESAPEKKGLSGMTETLLGQRLRELEKMDHLVSELYIDWKNGDITRDEYKMMKEKFETRAIWLKSAVRHIKEEAAVQYQNSVSSLPQLEDFLKYKNIKSLTQGLLGELIEEILIHAHGEITIVFKFEDPYQKITDADVEHKSMKLQARPGQPELQGQQV